MRIYSKRDFADKNAQHFTGEFVKETTTEASAQTQAKWWSSAKCRGRHYTGFPAVSYDFTGGFQLTSADEAT